MDGEPAKENAAPLAAGGGSGRGGGKAMQGVERSERNSKAQGSARPERVDAQTANEHPGRSGGRGRKDEQGGAIRTSVVDRQSVEREPGARSGDGASGVKVGSGSGGGRDKVKNARESTTDVERGEKNRVDRLRAAEVSDYASPQTETTS